MSNTHEVTTVDFEQSIMSKIKSNQIVMKPRWYFIVGSLVATAGLIGASITATFLINLMLFLFKQHGPMGLLRLQQLINSFPIWIPVVAVFGMVLGVWLLKKYEFSYKKNFWLISAAFIIAIIAAAFVMDYVGLNDLWSHRGPMRKFYQQIEGQSMSCSKGEGPGRNGWGNCSNLSGQ